MLARPVFAALLAGVFVLAPAAAAFAAGTPAPTVTIPSNRVVPQNAEGELELTGTGTPGAHLELAGDPTLAQMERTNDIIRAKLTAFANYCGADFRKCGGIAAVDSSGHWSGEVSVLTTPGRTVWVDVWEHVPGSAASSWISLPAPVELIVGAAQTSASNSASDPSVFSDLAAFNWQTFTPAHVTLSVGAALVLTLLLGLPTTLLNSALEASYDERKRRLKPLTDPVVRVARQLATRWKSATRSIPKPVAVASWFLIAAIVSGFADPTFGFTLESLRLLLSLFVAFALLNILGAYVTWWFTREDEHTPRPTFPPRPTNLIILILTVVVARLINLQPTLIFGTVLGVDMGVQLILSKKARVVLVGVIYSGSIGVLGWILYSLLPASWTGFAAVTVRELFSQLAIAGIATLPVTLLPFRSLQGETLWKWQRVFWGLSYAAGMLLFLFILLPMPFSWGGVSEPLVAWVLLFVIYSAIALATWLAVRYSWFSAAEKRYRAWRTG